MRLTDSIAGEEVHFEPNGPGHVISIEIGNRHFEFECTENDLDIIFDRLGEYLEQLDAQQRIVCEGSHMPAEDEAVTYLRRFVTNHGDGAA